MKKILVIALMKKLCIAVAVLAVLAVAYVGIILGGYEYSKLRAFNVLNLTAETCIVELKMCDQILINTEIKPMSRFIKRTRLKREGCYEMTVTYASGETIHIENGYDTPPGGPWDVYGIITKDKLLLQNFYD